MVNQAKTPYLVGIAIPLSRLNNNMIMRYFLLCFIITLAQHVQAQNFDLSRIDPTVVVNDTPLQMPWVGGLNNPQPHMTDLDGDGETELYIFDRQGERHLAFEITGPDQFTYAPELVEFFPENIPNWIVMRDFDGDGNPDLFGHSDTLVSGIQVQKGVRRNDGRLEFERLTWGDPLPLLYFELSNGSRTQIFVSTIDYPEVNDVDCDGDMDILTFNIGGGYVEFFQNQSQERGYGNDSLIFELADNCYGGIYESGLSPEVTLAASSETCATPFTGPGDVGSARHAGSTLLTFDNNQDGLLELFLGDVSFTEIVMLHNAGDCDDVWYNDQTLNFPEETTPVDIFFFPSSFYTDLNQDGTKDFIASSNQLRNAQDKYVFWYYENQGQDDLPSLSLVDSQYLVREMLDFGTGSIPVIFDVNNDGLNDLIVGNRELWTSTLNLSNSSLSLFINTGTAESPAFELVDENYLDMIQFQNTTSEFAPAFGDLNGDNRPDVVVGGQSGELFFYPNNSTTGPHTFALPIYAWMGIDVGQNARPIIVDLNRDGLNDLVIGTRSGRINYYQNQGTATAPFFDPNPEMAPNQIQLGGIDTRDIGSSLGYSAPKIVEIDGQYMLFTGTNRGQIEAYGNIDGNLDGDFTLLDYSVGDYISGFRTELAIGSFDNDEKYELLIGNGRGGLEFFQTQLSDLGSSSTHSLAATIELSLSPNPAKNLLQVQHTGLSNGKLRIYTLQGRLLLEKHITNGQNSSNLATDRLPAGVYMIELSNGQQRAIEKLVIAR